MLDALQESLLNLHNEELKVNKVGFARNVIQVVHEWSREEDLTEERNNALRTFENNCRVLFKKLNIMQRRAQQKLTTERLSQKIERLKKDFNARHPISARREDGIVLMDEIEGVLEANKDNESIKEVEAIKSAIQNLRRDYKLDIDMSKSIDDYIGFQSGLERIKYAGLLASQEEEITEEPVSDETLAETLNESQIHDSFVDEKVNANDAQGPTKSTNETNSHSESSTKRKPNSRK